MQEHLPDFPETSMDALKQQKFISQQLVEINKKLAKQQRWQKKMFVLIVGIVIFSVTLWQFAALPLAISGVILSWLFSRLIGFLLPFNALDQK